MRKKNAICALFAGALFLFFSPTIRAGEPVEIMAGEILLKYKKETPREVKENLQKEYDLTLVRESSATGVCLYQSKRDDVLPLIEMIKKHSAIEFVEPNYVIKKNSTPNDPFYSSQWYLPKISMPDAWSQFTGTTIVKIAVIDSGVNKSHPDLSGVLLSAGERDYVDYDGSADDVDGHGTLVAGIIGAIRNNNIGISGVSSSIRIIPIRTGDANGDHDIGDTTDAIEWAAYNGCKIINCSFGGSVYSSSMSAAITYADDMGALVICSSGNGGNGVEDGIGDNNDLLPSNYPSSFTQNNVLSVANTTSSDVLDSSSNYGANSVDIAGPGKEILSTLGVGEDYRESIINYAFDFSGQSWQGFYFYTGGLVGFKWNFFESGWETDYNIYSRQYSSYSSFYLESPLIDCRNYADIQLITTLSGGLGLGDSLGIYSGTTSWSGRQQAGSLLNGWVNASFTRYLWPLENTIGRVWYWLTSDAYGNGYVVIKNASVSGVPLYKAMSGTSFSAPIVSGVAAMLMSQNPSLTHHQVKDIILQTARKVPALNGKVVCGGIVDAAAALREAKARVVVRPVITSSTSASGTVGSSFSYSITASGTPTSYNASSLPSGLSVNTSTGVISGTPSSAGTFISSISASNTAGTGSASLRITIAKATPAIISAPTASAITYGQTLASSTLSGGSASVVGNFAWTMPSANLNLGTSSQGVIFTPNDRTNYNTVTTLVSVTVNQVTPLAITSDISAVSVNLGASFSHQITASGSPTSFAAKGLPTGLKVDTKTGLMSGKPTKAGVFSATLQALKKGSTTTTATKVFTVVQAPTFTYAATINATKGKALKVTPKIAGYPAPTFSILSGSLPPGMSLNASTAAITGIPTAVGTYPFTVRGSNSAGNTDRSTTIVVK
jgi:thermitase